MVIDTHQHFWKYDPQRDGWITDDMAILRRDYLPSDVGKEMMTCEVTAAVAVQADQSAEETNFLLSLADQYPFISGVVGWTDLRAPMVDAALQSLKHHQKLKGFRHILQGAPFLMKEKSFIDGVSTLGKYNFTYDLLIYHHQLRDAITFVHEVDDATAIVVDHIAKPAIKSNEFNQWAKSLQELAKVQRLYCKLSGMITETDWHHWKAHDIQRYIDHVFEVFGASRIIYGSDWPVCLLAGSYKEQFQLVLDYVGRLSATEKAAVLGENAKRFYNL